MSFVIMDLSRRRSVRGEPRERVAAKDEGRYRRLQVQVRVLRPPGTPGAGPPECLLGPGWPRPQAARRGGRATPVFGWRQAVACRSRNGRVRPRQSRAELLERESSKRGNTPERG